MFYEKCLMNTKEDLKTTEIAFSKMRKIAVYIENAGLCTTGIRSLSFSIGGIHNLIDLLRSRTTRSEAEDSCEC